MTTRWWGRTDIAGARLHYWAQENDGMHLRSMCGILYLASRVTPGEDGIRCGHCKVDARTQINHKAEQYQAFKNEHES